jgi:eukaryotic-like serine/threonine-protein kinase
MSSIDKGQWETISPLLDELLELDAAQLSMRLDELRRDDPQLADTVTRLLEQQTEVEREDFLHGAIDVRGLERVDASELAGQVIGNYTLERLLGQGGMGSVWLARRTDGHYEGKAALKLLNLALVSRGGAQRFQREGSILARLTHPNIARLIDAGVAKGQPYLVLEYVEGEAIDRWCDARGLGVDARVRLFMDVLAAVAHAHNNLTLHRDLKPSNILVDREGRVKLLDFGIAKLIENRERPAAATELTQLGGRAFTPEYAAPEQVASGDVTTATDVYALGVMLYVLLGGQHPTATENTAAVEQLRAVLETEPRRLSDVALRTSVQAAGARATTPPRLARDLRGDLDNIVAKALKKAPAERYPNAAALADDLRRFLTDQPVLARPDTLGYRVGKFVRRYRLAVGAASATLLALTAGVVGTTWQAVEARRAQALAEANAAEAREQREVAQFETRYARANHEFVSQLFGDAMRGGQSSEMRARLDRARELLRRRYADDPVVHALLLFQLAGRYAELGEKPQEMEVLQEVEQLSVRSNDPSLGATLACVKAYELIRADKLEAARPHVANGLRLMQSAARQISAAGFECYRADAMLATATGDHARGVAQMQRWLGQLERDGLEKTRLYLNSLGSLAFIHGMAGELVSALDVSRRVRALNEALGSELTLSSQLELDRESELLIDLGRFSEAIDVDRELLRRFATFETAGSPPPFFIPKLARHALIGGSAKDAAAWLQSALPIYERDGPEVNARGATLDLAVSYVLQGRYGEARSTLRRYEARLTKGPPRPRERIEAARIRVQIASDVRDSKDLDPALDVLEAALTERAHRLVVLQGFLAAGFGRLEQGKLETARSHAEQALKLASAKIIDGQSSAWVGAAYLLFARIALAEDDRPAARSHLGLASRQFADTINADHRWRKAADSMSAGL